jgi:hypothetical protein
MCQASHHQSCYWVGGTTRFCGSGVNGWERGSMGWEWVAATREPVTLCVVFSATVVFQTHPQFRISHSCTGFQAAGQLDLIERLARS